MTPRRVAAFGAAGLGLAMLFAARPLLAQEEAATEETAQEESLRERLTEREDERLPVKPLVVDVLGHPLTLAGELELQVAPLRLRLPADEEPERRVLTESQLETEAFYTLGQPLSVFAQVRFVVDQDILPGTSDSVSDVFVERGEAWLYSESVGGTPIDVEIGRLHFEDERRWWWDDDLDAVRVDYDGEDLWAALALAREIAPERSDLGYVEPEHEGVVRLIGEATWDWRENHGLGVFLLLHADRSPRERVGDVARAEREDGEDARLAWLGARATGVLLLGARGLLGYWLDGAALAGDERAAEWEPRRRGRSEVVATERRGVGGWAFDVGASWILPLAAEPRLYGGLAAGSGDDEPERGDARAFRQTRLHGNEAGFGGVERFPHYGWLLDPELANLGVLTLGAGVSLLRNSSLDLVYHRYRLLEIASELPGQRADFDLSGDQRDVGDGVDLVLAMEDWAHLELELIASAFRAGGAFETPSSRWSYGALVALRWVF